MIPILLTLYNPQNEWSSVVQSGNLTSKSVANFLTNLQFENAPSTKERKCVHYEEELYLAVKRNIMEIVALLCRRKCPAFGGNLVLWLFYF